MSLLLFAVAASCLAADAPQAPAKTETLHGKLVQRAGQPPALQTADHKLIALSGDEPTTKILNDKRLAGFDLQIKGHLTGPEKFLIDPVHTRSLLVNKNGHLKMVTYWCSTCSIRSYEPGPCWCCQQETTLDLRDPDQDN